MMIENKNSIINTHMSYYLYCLVVCFYHQEIILICYDSYVSYLIVMCVYITESAVGLFIQASSQTCGWCMYEDIIMAMYHS